ncbi:uncharacterized protein QC763_700932 [Podospora pseudopauciseta]|nr:hypothetical protein QC763_700932 [Podospora pseudopauciseta]KAK4668985.1 hypothetical protein QC764_700932 [Podospora pseudoanserina]
MRRRTNKQQLPALSFSPFLNFSSRSNSPSVPLNRTVPLKMAFITRLVSITNFAVATTALCFQVTVLYPWHKQLDEDFEALKTEHLKVLDAINKLTGSQLKPVEPAHPRKGSSLWEKISGR